MSDATELKLKVAMALYAVENHDLMGGWDTECATPELRAYWVNSARAAIEAMNIPALLTETRTKALEEAAKEADSFICDIDGGHAAEVIAANIRNLKAEGGEI